MKRTHRASMIAAVILCFVSAQGSATLFASDDAHAVTKPLDLNAAIAASHLDFAPSASNAANAQIFRGRPYRAGRNHNAAIAALMIGAAATITGTALLVYANRPDCSANPNLGGCGYGMKVVGTSVLVGGVAGLFVGGMTWR